MTSSDFLRRHAVGGTEHAGAGNTYSSAALLSSRSHGRRRFHQFRRGRLAIFTLCVGRLPRRLGHRLSFDGGSDACQRYRSRVRICSAPPPPTPQPPPSRSADYCTTVTQSDHQTTKLQSQAADAGGTGQRLPDRLRETLVTFVLHSSCSSIACAVLCSAVSVPLASVVLYTVLY